MSQAAPFTAVSVGSVAVVVMSLTPNTGTLLRLESFFVGFDSTSSPMIPVLVEVVGLTQNFNGTYVPLSDRNATSTNPTAQVSCYRGNFSVEPTITDVFESFHVPAKYSMGPTRYYLGSGVEVQGNAARSVGLRMTSPSGTLSASGYMEFSTN